MAGPHDAPPPAIREFYERGLERARLSLPAGEIEALRTRECLLPLLPPPPARIADVGGGPGDHACWLAELGHEVALLDATDLHVEQALALALRRGVADRVGASTGDARQLPFEDATLDVVLLLGPLYHLQERAERDRCWAEAARVLKAGGLVAAAGISRGAALLDGLRSGALADDAYRQMALEDLRSGRHECPPGKPWFTTAYMHEPEELLDEAAAAGFEDARLEGLEGLGAYLPDLAERWADPDRRESVLMAARAIGRHHSLRALSPHLLLTARRPRAA